MDDVIEKMAAIVAEAHAAAQRKHAEAEREAVEDLVIELREHTYAGYHGWHFDLGMEEAVDRVRRFLDERGAS